MIIKTKRLILRPWELSDSEELYKYAKDPDVGPIAGWRPHKSVDDSFNIIKTVLSEPETYAIVLKETNKPVGSIGVMTIGTAPMKENEAEIGYWLGKPYWGNGYVPEAMQAILKRCFSKLSLKGVWCGYYDGNIKSKRVQEKCGFIYHHTEENKPCVLMEDIRTEHFTYMSAKLFFDMQKIRKARITDLPALTKIYNYEVKNGTATLDIKEKTLKERELWFYAHNIKNHPLIVLEENDEILGYASLSSYRPKEAYNGAVELSVYISPEHREKGVGTALVNKILTMARNDKRTHTVISVITGGNDASIKLHEKFGFIYSGTIKNVAVKFQKFIGIDNYSLDV